jgi:hypothetical protein
MRQLRVSPYDPRRANDDVLLQNQSAAETSAALSLATPRLKGAGTPD